MQKDYKKIWCSIVTIILIVSFCIPFYIKADTGTYFIGGSGCNYAYYYKYSGHYKYGSLYLSDVQGEVRFVLFKNPSFNNSGTYARLYAVSLSPFKSSSYEADVGTSLVFPDSCPTMTNTSSASSYIKNNVTYYIENVGLNATSSKSNYGLNPDLPYVEYNGSYSGNTGKDIAIYYTFGEGAVAPVPPVNHGDLIDLGYFTNFTNSTQSNISQMRHNKDTITWNGYNDSNGNKINTLEYQVEIQAYSTEYQASTKSDLLNKTIVDVVNWGSPTTIYEGSANRGQFEIEWGDVAEYLNGSSVTDSFWTQLWPHLNENMWYSLGWNYRIRLKTSDDSYIGQWQTIYTMTSAPPADAETVYNYYYYYGGQGVTDDVVDVLYNINTTNNTSNVWYINNNQVDPSGGSSNWLETLLKFIADMIGKILDLFSSMFDSVLDFLLGLIDGFDPVGTFTNWWNQLKIKFDSIDLTLPIFNIPDDENLSGFGDLVQKTIEIYTTNGLGFMIFIPLLLLILKVIL